MAAATGLKKSADAARGEECRLRPRQGDERRQGHPAALANLGATELPPSRQAGATPPRRLLRVRPRPRRHRRARGSPAPTGGGERRPRGRRRPLVVRVRRRAVPAASDAVARRWPRNSSATAIWDRYKKWPVYSKFFDNMGPIPHHMHQSFADAELVGQEGKPESYYFPPQYNNCDNNFPYTFMGLEPRHDEGRSPPLPGETGTRATTASSTTPRRIAWSGARAG